MPMSSTRVQAKPRWKPLNNTPVALSARMKRLPLGASFKLSTWTSETTLASRLGQVPTSQPATSRATPMARPLVEMESARSGILLHGFALGQLEAAVAGQQENHPAQIAAGTQMP